MKSKQRKFIKTNLLGKEEVYRHLALGEAIRSPVLLVGSAGIAKTATVNDWVNCTRQVFDIETGKYEDVTDANSDKVFFIETDADTRAKEIKGHIDMKELTINNNYTIRTPIKDFSHIVINEIDKASSSFRNACLSIMNEKKIFNGEQIVPCDWSLFVGTCNVIPEDEVGSPFWDRFLIKMTVDRLSHQEIIKYYKDGDKKAVYNYTINLPTTEEIESVIIPDHKLVKFLEVCHSKCTDRVLSFVPTLIKAITFIWDCSIDKAIIKAAEIVVDRNAANALSQKIMSNHLKQLYTDIDLVAVETDPTQIANKIDAIDKLIATLSKSGEISKDEIEDLGNKLSRIIESHPLTQAKNASSGESLSQA